MNELIQTGKTRTIQISVSILLVSIHTIYFYHTVRPEIETLKLVQQVARFLLTVGLLVITYRGKKWAKNTSLVLFSVTLLGALIGIGTFEGSIVNKVPLSVMIIVYSLAVYHFGFSKGYKAFFEHQNGRKIKLDPIE